MATITRRGALGLVVMSAVCQAWTARDLIAGDRNAPVAIRGYDTVAYFTLGKPTPGLPQLEHEWDGQTYRFSRDEHREIFKADPVRYAPQFANFCAMALTRGELVEANPENWLISDGKLFMFAKPVGVDMFQKGTTENTDKAAQHWPAVLRR